MKQTSKTAVWSDHASLIKYEKGASKVGRLFWYEGLSLFLAAGDAGDNFLSRHSRESEKLISAALWPGSPLSRE